MDGDASGQHKTSWSLAGKGRDRHSLAETSPARLGAGALQRAGASVGQEARFVRGAPFACDSQGERIGKTWELEVKDDSYWP